MSTRQDHDLDSKRRLFALVLVLAFMLYAVAATSGCAGINFRHMTVKVNGERIVVPDDLAREYVRIRGPVPQFTTGNWSYAEFPTPWYTGSPYSHTEALAAAVELALWCRENGYKCDVLIIKRKGRAPRAVTAVSVQGVRLYFDPLAQSIDGRLGKWAVVHTLFNFYPYLTKEKT